MKSLVSKNSWFSSILELQEVKIPEIKDNEVLIKVFAVGVNRADTVDVATNGVCPGLECSGIIKAIGSDVSCWKVGQRVCAILKGGGCAEQVAVRADFLLPLPDDIDLGDAAGLPYASCCIWLALFKMHDPEQLKDKRILIREGTSGIGALAIQYAKYMGLQVIATTGSSDKFSICHDYGADYCVDHTSTPTPFYVVFMETCGCKAVDFVLDYGGSNLKKNINCCNPYATVAIVDLHGTKCSLNLYALQQANIEIKVVNLRFRDWSYIASTIAELKTHLWPAIFQRKVVPVIDYRFPAIEAQKALDLVKKNDSIGKIIVYMDFDSPAATLNELNIYTLYHSASKFILAFLQ